MNAKSREAFQPQERIRTRLARASFRLEMAELERIWAIVSANREGMSVRDIARQVGLGPTRVHQLVTSPEAECVDQALSVLREAGWPAPEDPQADTEEQVADRLTEEATALISCAEWLASLAAGERPVVNLRPNNDLPDTNYVAVDQDRVIRVLRRIAHDLEELARTRRVEELSSSANDADPRPVWLARLPDLLQPGHRRGTSPLSMVDRNDHAHGSHRYRIDLAKRIGCYPKSKQPGSTEILEAIEEHIAKLDSTGCMRLLFDIALLPDIRSQWSTTADGNLKKVASRFRIDTAAIGKTVRAQASMSTKRASTKRKEGAA